MWLFRYALSKISHPMLLCLKEKYLLTSATIYLYLYNWSRLTQIQASTYTYMILLCWCSFVHISLDFQYTHQYHHIGTHHGAIYSQQHSCSCKTRQCLCSCVDRSYFHEHIHQNLRDTFQIASSVNNYLY